MRVWALEMTPPPGATIIGGSPPKIGGGDALVFQMELITIKGDKVEQTMGAADESLRRRSVYFVRDVLREICCMGDVGLAPPPTTGHSQG